jgi:hypothetical protein
MANYEILLISAGTLCSFAAVLWYVWQIYKMPAADRTDWHNLVRKKGSAWRNGANWLLAIGIALLLSGYAVGA